MHCKAAVIVLERKSRLERSVADALGNSQDRHQTELLGQGILQKQKHARTRAEKNSMSVLRNNDESHE